MIRMLTITVCLAALVAPARADVYRTTCSYTADGREGTYEVIVDDRAGLAMFVTKDPRDVPSAESRSRLVPLAVQRVEQVWPMRHLELRNPENHVHFVLTVVDHDYQPEGNVAQPQERITSFDGRRTATDECGKGE